ncbi:hypothetical protein JCM8547_003326 [Rhodosporidiobolus lusitaniae]
MAKFFTKPTILFLSLNVLRALSIIAILLVFAGEIYTMVVDIQGYHSTSSSSTPSTSSSTASTSPATATTKIVRRNFVPHAVPAVTSSVSPVHSLILVDAQATATAAAVVSENNGRMVRHKKVRREHITSSTLEDDAEESSISSTTTTTKKRTPTSSFSTAQPTATNSAQSASSSDTREEEQQACAYVGKTSIPKTTGGILFATLERIFCVLILLLSLLSELPLPPSLYLHTTRFWSWFFPPFGPDFGVGVLGAVQVWIGCSVLSKAVEGWVQGGGWVLFLVGVMNLLAGLAFGSRLNPIRSCSADSTSPSALRRLRLANNSSSETAPSSQWSRFQTRTPSPHPHFNEHPIYDEHARASLEQEVPEPEREMVQTTSPSFRPKRSKSSSRNGPNGIVISPPRPLRPSMVGEPDSRDGRDEASSRGKGVVSPPPPTYFPGSRI